MGDTVFPRFPRGFLFGAATAAYQVEGAAAADGKGLSVWDAFARRRGRIRRGETGDEACDHYRRYREDVAIMRSLGLGAYRGSISWPRVLPEGRGRPNPAGLDFYSRLTDELLAAGVRSFFTLFHWDLPLALQREIGGFRSRDAAPIFADYAELVVRALGDRVKDWITVNEPWEYSFFGHLTGDHAPGIMSPRAYFAVMHNLLRGHGMAVERIRGACPGARVGAALSQTPVFPATGSEADAWSTRMADAFMNRITLDPMLKGAYPPLLLERAGSLFPRIEAGDLEEASRPVDFVGLNFYSRERASHRWFVPWLKTWVSGKDGGRGESEEGGVRRTAMGWEVWPEGMGLLARMMRDEYGNPPVFFTENGAAFADEVSRDPDGNPRVRDPKRVDFLRDYLSELAAAAREGCDLRGYFVWSLMDNFEWAEGYAPRFGIVRVEPGSLERTVKDSGLWYRDLIRANAEGEGRGR